MCVEVNLIQGGKLERSGLGGLAGVKDEAARCKPGASPTWDAAPRHAGVLRLGQVAQGTARHGSASAPTRPSRNWKRRKPSWTGSQTGRPGSIRWRTCAWM
jgi:hypothetical protein